jgi:hypothetical protein
MGETEIRYSMTTRQKLMFLPVWLIATGERALLGKSSSSIFLSAVTAWSVFFLVKCRRSTTITPYGIALWNFRTTRIPWTAITAVDKVKGPLFTDFVQLSLADGKTMTLRAPQNGPLQHDPRFAVKADVIRAWWRLHSGHPAEADLVPASSSANPFGSISPSVDGSALPSSPPTRIMER